MTDILPEEFNETITYTFPDKIGTTRSMKITKELLNVTTKGKKKRYRLSFNETQFPGNYKIKISGTNRELGYSVNLKPIESELEHISNTVEPDKNPVLVSLPDDIVFKYINNEKELKDSRSEAQEGNEVYFYFMILLLCVMCLESFLSNRFYTE